MGYIEFIRSKVGRSRIFLPCASALVIRSDGKVLVEVRADNRMMAFPGGCQELDETSEETAVREVKEETGLDASILAKVGVVEKPRFAWPNGDQAHTIVFLYALKPSDEKQALSIGDGESLSLCWMAPKEALEACEPFEGREVVEAYRSFLAKSFPNLL